MARGRERPVMELRVAGILDGEHPFTFEVDPDAINLDRFDGKVTVAGTLRKVSKQVFVEAELSGSLIGECDRCLAEVRRDVRVPMNLFFHVTPEARRPHRDEDVEIQALHPEQDVIVLDDEVRQALLLQVPLKVLCRDECAGLCPRCGADLNNGEHDCEESAIDPRWAGLSELFKKKDEE